MAEFTPGQILIYRWVSGHEGGGNRAPTYTEAEGIFLSYVGKASAKVKFNKPGGTVIQTVALSKLRGRDEKAV